MILLDTDHCVFLLRGTTQVTRHFVEHTGEAAAISIITLGELHYGAYRSTRLAENLRLCEEFTRSVRVLPLTPAVMLQFAALKHELRTAGQSLEDPDLLIAATALCQDATLVSGNTKHYTRIPSLRLLNWRDE